MSKYIVLALIVGGFFVSGVALAASVIKVDKQWAWVKDSSGDTLIYRVEDKENKAVCYVSYYPAVYHTNPSTSCVGVK